MKDIALLMALNHPSWALPVETRGLWARVASQDLGLPEQFDEKVWFAEMDRLLALKLVQKTVTHTYRVTPEGLDYLKSMRKAMTFLGRVAEELA